MRLGGREAATTRRSRAALLLFALLFFGRAAPVPSQELTGVIVRPDSTSVAGVTVELHRVTEEEGALLDSTRTDGSGRFSFPLPDDQPGALFLAGARYQGVLYWGPPVHSTAQPDAGDYPVLVYDTLQVQSPALDLGTTIRHAVITPASNALQVEEIFDVRGRPDRTLVPASDSSLVWLGALARGAQGVLAAPGGVPPEDVVVLGDRIGFRGALPPSGIRLVIQYFVRGLEYQVTTGNSIGRLELLAMPGPGTLFEVSGISEAPARTGMPVPVRRFTASELEAGETVSLAVTFQDPPRSKAWIWLLAAFALGAAAFISMRLNGRTS